jgi:hypothetical protein
VPIHYYSCSCSYFLSAITYALALKHAQPPITWIPRELFPRATWLEHKTHNTLPSSTNVKNTEFQLHSPCTCISSWLHGMIFKQKQFYLLVFVINIPLIHRFRENIKNIRCITWLLKLNHTLSNNYIILK